MGNSEDFKKFMHHSGLSEVSARRALTPGGGLPHVKCRPLVGAAGVYISRRTTRGFAPSDRVFLDTALLRHFEKVAEHGPSDEFQNLSFGLYVAIVHEIVHWGADRDGWGGVIEEGDAWERDMFGHDIEFYFNRLTRRYRIE
jgi:hypothetical protein